LSEPGFSGLAGFFKLNNLGNAGNLIKILVLKKKLQNLILIQKNNILLQHKLKK